MANAELPIPEFTFTPDDPLAAEHAVVKAWVERDAPTFGLVPADPLPPKGDAQDKALFGGDANYSRRIALATLAQFQFWTSLDLNQYTPNMSGAVLPHFDNRWLAPVARINTALCKSKAVLDKLLLRKLPFDREDMRKILRWGIDAALPGERGRSTVFFMVPYARFVRALKTYASSFGMDEQVRSEVEELTRALRVMNYGDHATLVVDLKKILDDLQSPEKPQETATARTEAPRPAYAGTPGILESLKRQLGMREDEPLPVKTLIQPDYFPLLEDSPLFAEHAFLGELFVELNDSGPNWYWTPNLNRSNSASALANYSPSDWGELLLATAERHREPALDPSGRVGDVYQWMYPECAGRLALMFAQRPLEFDRPGMFDLAIYFSTLGVPELALLEKTLAWLLKRIGEEAAKSPLTEGERYALSVLRSTVIFGPLGAGDEATTKGLTDLIGDGARFYLVPGEVWADQVNADIGPLSTQQQTDWQALFAHLLTATSARPSGKWIGTAKKLLEAIGADAVSRRLAQWLPLVTKGRSRPAFPRYSGHTHGTADVIHPDNATALRGMLWLMPLLPADPDYPRLIGQVALSAYKKVPGVGPRAVKVGNAAIYALSTLGTLEAVGQLAMLKTRVKFGSAQKEIEKAYNAAATALGLPRDQIEELGIPAYGLEEVGRRIETFGEYRAELVVHGTQASLDWYDAKGKKLKAVPAKVKEQSKEEVDELKVALKDIQGMLTAQRDRIDGLFLLEKTWKISDWRQRYLDHPLVGALARRLIWTVDGTPAFFPEGEPTDVTGQPLAYGGTAEIALWHPIGRPVEEVTAWRARLETLQVTQPFKQAHREVYLLTDAERNTAVYSNRFAAHIVRQHQLNALCAARGWKYALRLMVDADFPPATRELPQYGLRAEFWVEPVGDDFGSDTNDAGTYYLVATDQVRFHRIDAAKSYVHGYGGGYGRGGDDAAVPLDQIPPLVLSEILRDVDLFVGVASVGNDPTWQDGGPDGRHQRYWESFSFGDLSATAKTRRQTLERLLPRLKIAPLCELTDRFLVVRGELRTYKIHLGSGNILMEPNDEYLCIVPSSRQSDNDLYLPFEGDRTLSIILSKALLLADDTKIKDPTITRQIKRK